MPSLGATANAVNPQPSTTGQQGFVFTAPQPPTAPPPPPPTAPAAPPAATGQPQAQPQGATRQMMQITSGSNTFYIPTDRQLIGTLSQSQR